MARLAETFAKARRHRLGVDANRSRKVSGQFDQGQFWRVVVVECKSRRQDTGRWNRTYAVGGVCLSWSTPPLASGWGRETA